jgi:hypothetical protein
MDTVIFTGSLTEDELKHERPDAYERWVKDGTLEARVVDPPRPRLVRRGRMVGTIAIVLGLTMFVLIIYAVTTHP